ncbi:MAG: 4Fe-4S dicluster domain-containing protein [Proteobacteria bacterium]|nr:4Fe-4S dicluster domain-containing protein [Pseudomonadota bacterium]
MNAVSDIAREAGIIGAGGAGFPTHVKLSGRAEIVIANGAECEPLLEADVRLMEERAFEVVEGLCLAMAATGAQKGYLAVKAKNEAAIRAVDRVLSAVPEDIEVHLLDDYYPAGDEFVLVPEVTGRRVPAMGIPISVGVVVHNVGSLFNLHQARLGKPVTERRLTVTGFVRKTQTMTVPVGALAFDVLAAVGGPTCADPVIIAGGPMMGRVVDTLDEPVTKTTSGLIVLPATHPLAVMRTMPLAERLARTRTACDLCRRCTDLCPRFGLGHQLRPDEILRAVGYSLRPPEFDGLYRSAWLCSGCNLCELYACPLFLYPASINVALKAEMAAGGLGLRAAQQAPLPRPETPRVLVNDLIRRLGLSAVAKQDIGRQERPLEVDRVRLLMRQHLGAPAAPVVRIGDQVEAGQVVGEIPRGALGARVHASINGRVTAVSAEAVEVAA